MIDPSSSEFPCLSAIPIVSQHPTLTAAGATHCRMAARNALTGVADGALSDGRTRGIIQKRLKTPMRSLLLMFLPITPLLAQQGPITTLAPTISYAATAAIAAITKADSGKDKGHDRLWAMKVVADLKQTTTASAPSAPLARGCLAQAKAAASVVSFGCWWPHLSATSPDEADEFFGTLKTLGAMSLSLGQKEGALYSELLSDNLWVGARAGFARVGFATQVSSPSDTTRPTVTQFFQGGGNAVLYGALPLTSYMNFFGLAGQDKKLIRRLDIYATSALAGDVPGMSSSASIDESTESMDAIRTPGGPSKVDSVGRTAEQSDDSQRRPSPHRRFVSVAFVAAIAAAEA
jgi:hypothetical protein